MARARFRTTLTVVLLAALGTAASAQEHGREHDRGPDRGPPRGPVFVGPGPHVELDQRYRHDHYYPPRGQVVAVLPGGAVSVGYGGANWFFHGGVWFRPVGPRWVVAPPPIGIVIPMLPPDVTTLWIGGAPYYYANGVYYAPAPAPAQGYAVVQPPEGAQAAQPVPALPATRALPDPILYPRNGQSPAQTEADRQECNRWATTQPSALADAQIFQRAVAACMDGRGYTVR